jgi:hypothetical protein
MEFKRLITERFAINVARVRGLIGSFKKLRKRRSCQHDDPRDVLRAAVVLLHATLEDLLRSLEELVLQRPSKGALKPITFPPERGKAHGDGKFTLMDLHTRFHGQTVDAVVREAIEAHLEQQTYNNLADVNEALVRLGLHADPITLPLKQHLMSMIRRRHWIAHRVDVATTNPQKLLHLLGPSPIDANLVDSWTCAVERFGTQVLGQFQEPLP